MWQYILCDIKVYCIVELSDIKEITANVNNRIVDPHYQIIWAKTPLVIAFGTGLGTWVDPAILTLVTWQPATVPLRMYLYCVILLGK